jgi:hypothetical protein
MFNLKWSNNKTKFVKHNNGWDAEPNAPMPSVELLEGVPAIKLSFYLNSFIYDDVDEEDKGILEFYNCYQYRIGATNDEGFYRGQCRFYKSGIEWGHFYNIIESTWRKDFPSDKIIVENTLVDSPNLNHYLFYFRDETFECIAESYNFAVIRGEN